MSPSSSILRNMVRKQLMLTGLPPLKSITRKLCFLVYPPTENYKTICSTWAGRLHVLLVRIPGIRTNHQCHRSKLDSAMQNLLTCHAQKHKRQASDLISSQLQHTVVESLRKDKESTPVDCSHLTRMERKFDEPCILRT